MGLDVYLYRYEDFEKAKAAEKEYEEQSEANWNVIGNYDKATYEQKEEVCKKNRALQETLGYTFEKSESGFEIDHSPGESKIEINSAKYPDHYFKVGYFRSSYNDGGIERVIGNLLGTYGCLHIIFPENNQYEFRPNWSASLERVQSMIRAFDEKTQKGSFRCFAEDMNHFRSIQEYKQIDAKRAMEIFIEQNEKKHGDGYSNRDGSFFFGEKPLSVRGLIPGFKYGTPCVYVIHESDLSWYRQALEIVEETILWVLGREDKNKFYLHWSS